MATTPRTLLKEPAWHSRERKKRASARLALRAANGRSAETDKERLKRAEESLSSHHGSMVPDKNKNQAKRGFWRCYACGYETALGVPKCACGHVPRPGVCARRALSGQEGARASAEVDQRINQLERKLEAREKELKAAREEATPAEEAGNEQQQQPDIAAMQKSYAEMVRHMGADDVTAVVF